MNSAQPFIVDITLENAQAYLIDESFQRPVVVDFWADWCAPCKNLMPILEKLATEYAGAFLLAKINADDPQTQMIGAQFGVRSLPTVMIMKDGQPVDGFAGALPELQVREVLAKYLPKPWEVPLSQAQQLMADEKFSEALPLLRDAYEQSGQLASINLLIAQCYLELNRVEPAEDILANIKLADQDALFEQLKARLDLIRQAAKTPELAALETAHQQAPDDLQVRYQLALQYHQESVHRPALEQLFFVLQKDRGFAEGEARKVFNAILASLGKGDPLAIEFQRKLFTLLY